MDYISELIKHTEDHESPTSFWRWSGYVTIAATLRDNAYFLQGINKIYPNLWILLLSDDPGERKGPPLDLAKKVLEGVNNTKVIAGRASVQGILEDLSKGGTDSKTGKIISGGSCLLCADELASFFVKDPDLITLLTYIYDFKEKMPYTLRGTGMSFVINNLCVSLLAASNENYLKEVYTKEAVFGGLLSRTQLIKPNEFRPGNSLWDSTEERYKVTHLINILKNIAILKGIATVELSAQKEFDSWYKPLRESYKLNRDKTGVLYRIHTSVLKLALVIGVNYNMELIVRKENVEQAISECMFLLGNYEKYVMSSGSSDIARAGSLFLNELYSKGGQCTRTHVMSKYWFEIGSADVLDKVVIALEQGGHIIRSFDGQESFILTAKGREIFEKNKGEKK